MLKRMASKRTNIPSIKQCPDLTNYVIIITVYRENNVKLVNTLCVAKGRVFNVKTGYAL